MSRRAAVILIISVMVFSATTFFVLESLFATSRVCGLPSPPPVLPSGQPSALLTFGGYSNAVFRWKGTSETCATFCLTNTTARRITYYAESLERLTPTGWQRTMLRCTPTNWYRFGTTLDRCEACIFHVPPPDAERWRIRITCVEKATGVQGIKDRIADYRANPGPGEDGTRVETFSGFTYQIVSCEVKP